jgi:hypothetical protein
MNRAFLEEWRILEERKREILQVVELFVCYNMIFIQISSKILHNNFQQFSCFAI